MRNVLLMVDRDVSSLKDLNTHLLQSPMLANVIMYELDPDNYPKHTLSIITYK